MRHLLTLLIFASFLSCYGQPKERQLYFPQVNWTLSFPKNSEFFSWKQFDSLQNETANKLKSRDYLFTQQEVLFIIKNGDNNFFGSTITPIDSLNFQTWESSYANSKKQILYLLQSRKTIITVLDSTYSVEQIDQKLFQRFYIKTFYPQTNITRETYWYYREEKGIELSINISFNDSIIGNKYLSLLRESKFDK
jgi:hypothetical protein